MRLVRSMTLLKKSKKITGKILGSITESNGFVESVIRVLSKKAESSIDFAGIVIKEQGFASFINSHFQVQVNKLKTYFADDWEQIIAIIYCRIFIARLKIWLFIWLKVAD